MITREKLEALARYTSDVSLPFNEEELRIIFALLNINQQFGEIEEKKLNVYRDAICATATNQNRTMTALCGELLRIQERKSDIDALKYALENITEVSSPFMLDILFGFLNGLPRSRA
jgi:hypothetical protein